MTEHEPGIVCTAEPENKPPRIKVEITEHDGTVHTSYDYEAPYNAAQIYAAKSGQLSLVSNPVTLVVRKSWLALKQP